MNTNMNKPRIGCAGWSLSTDVAPHFPTEGSHLERYAAVFNAVEINSSFYRPHQPKTYARWADSVPDDFLFSVKLPRTITHERRLADSDELLAAFAGQAGALDRKLGCVLVQLPPSLALEAGLADAFFGLLRGSFACDLACEARHASWFGDDATEILQRYGIIRVRADPQAVPSAIHKATTPAEYARLHGSPRIYYDKYTEQQLADLAAWLTDRSGWCIFDNTAAGAALPNALRLQQLV